ncbi:MAG: glycine dehydrogenase, partial [Chloroflexota bacterium]
IKKVAHLAYHKAHYAAKQIDTLPGYGVDMSKPFFNEFMVKCPVPVEQVNATLIENGIVGGYDLGQDYDHMANTMLLAVTEMNRKDEIDALVEVLRDIQA